jgi:AraC-like DNA-binding protein
MKDFAKCKEAIESCLASRRFAVAYLHSEEKTMDMHIHNCFELYFSISGGTQFFVGDKCYKIEPGDVFAINNYESHYLSPKKGEPHDRIVISIHPDFLKDFSTSQTDISYCFTHRDENFVHRLSLDKEQQKKFIYLSHKITSAEGFGADIIENCAFCEMMVMLNALYKKQNDSRQDVDSSKYRHSELAGKIIDYINLHITEKLQISTIAKEFFLSETYVCRVFKAETGTTINKYLTARRISIAKALLADGYSVAETCEKSGFNDYTNFVKAFTKAVGISPKKYGKYSAN